MLVISVYLVIAHIGIPAWGHRGRNDEPNETEVTVHANLSLANKAARAYVQRWYAESEREYHCGYDEQVDEDEGPGAKPLCKEVEMSRSWSNEVTVRKEGVQGMDLPTLSHVHALMENTMAAREEGNGNGKRART